MSSAQDFIGVVVLEPNKTLLDKLCVVAKRVWGDYEVLPRQTGRELKVAAENLHVGVVIVRSSFQRSSDLVQRHLLDLYAEGTQIVVIQDGASRISENNAVSMGGVHFLSDTAGDEALANVLTLALVKHCLPRNSKLF